MSKVPKEKFVSQTFNSECYKNVSLPINFGQYINEPLITANLYKAAEIKPTDILLEIGTGSGYEGVLFTYLCKKVYSIETFDVVIVSTTNEAELYELIKKLKPGARLVIIAEHGSDIKIIKLKKDNEEHIFCENIYPKHFKELKHNYYEEGYTC